MSIEIYSVGVVVACACAPKSASSEEVENVATEYVSSLAGEHTPVAISTDQHFATGQPNPCPCNRSSDRLHYLLSY